MEARKVEIEMSGEARDNAEMSAEVVDEGSNAAGPQETTPEDDARGDEVAEEGLQETTSEDEVAEEDPQDTTAEGEARGDEVPKANVVKCLTRKRRMLKWKPKTSRPSRPSRREQRMDTPEMAVKTLFDMLKKSRKHLVKHVQREAQLDAILIKMRQALQKANEKANEDDTPENRAEVEKMQKRIDLLTEYHDDLKKFIVPWKKRQELGEVKALTLKLMLHA